MPERLRILNTPHEGVKTGERPPYPLPSLVGGEIRCLPPYVEITTDDGTVLQAHPNKVEIVDKFAIILIDPLDR